jgi:hypothetical protein
MIFPSFLFPVFSLFDAFLPAWQKKEKVSSKLIKKMPKNDTCFYSSASTN